MAHIMRSVVVALLLIVVRPAFAQYEANWNSLAKHQPAPEWFQDAKLGIYFHWGVYSVPAYGDEWYPRNMHLKDHPVYRHHLATYGSPDEYGYDRFVEGFTAEKFDAVEWANLFKLAGARFAGPVAEHHDGFALWDSQLTPWNAVDRGPHRDLVGELAASIRERDMRFITTFHHERNNLFQKDGQWTGHFDGALANFPSALKDTERAIMYGYMPRQQFLDMWLGKLKEVIDNYQPEIIWFDSWLEEIPAETRQEFCAYYLNAAAKWNREVVIVRKQDDLPLDFTVFDHEKSRESGLSDRVWMTDDTISTGSWCYTNGLKIKSAEQVVHSLVDTVSKNGVVLLNISPMADGTIPDDQRSVLLELGNWLKQYGASIYKTRPWLTYGEGPTKEPEGGFSDAGKFLQLAYSAADVRYTRSKDGKTIYAILLGIPAAETPIHLQSFARDGAGAGVAVSNVEVLGHDTPITWKRDAEGLHVTFDEKVDAQLAIALKITTN